MEENTKQKDENNLRAHVANLAALVEYWKGSVASRTIIKKKTGTVMLFSSDKGKGLSEQTAPYDALVFVVDGEAKVTIFSNSIIIKVAKW